MVVSINGIKKELPSSWMDIKARHYERIISEWDWDKPLHERNYFKLFNILCDEEFESFQDTPENEVTIWNAVRWVIEETYQPQPMPKVLELSGQLIEIPKNVKASSVGQNIMLKQLLSKSKYLEQNISEAVAIYLQPIIDKKKFNYERALELKKEIEQKPAWLIQPIGFFLLKNASVRGSGQKNFYERAKDSLKAKLNKALLNSHRLAGLMRSAIYLFAPIMVNASGLIPTRFSNPADLILL